WVVGRVLTALSTAAGDGSRYGGSSLSSVMIHQTSRRPTGMSAPPTMRHHSGASARARRRATTPEGAAAGVVITSGEEIGVCLLRELRVEQRLERILDLLG